MRHHYLKSCPPGRMFGNIQMTLIFLFAATISTSCLNGYRVFVYVDRLFNFPHQPRRSLNSPPKRTVEDLPTYYIPANAVIRMK